MGKVKPVFNVLPPLSLYVHLPWCESKCPYCDFNSHPLRSELPESAYLDALLSDLTLHVPEAWSRSLTSVFIGGGTPSLFSARGVHRLISGIRARVPCAPGMEISLEANPGSCDVQNFAGFRDAGVNRISIGIQSFHTRRLKDLGRIHDRTQALAAAEAAHTAGFDNVNLDLMFGLPDQTVQQAVCDIETAISKQPTHISSYQLTLEPNTLFYRHPPTLPTEDETWEMQLAIQSQLTTAGYCRYEVSAYTKDSHQCKHNLNYWQFGDYLGIGAGAHSKISFADRVIRSMKRKHPNSYLNHASTNARVATSYELTTQDLCFEFLMNALRLTQGFSPLLFQQRTGQSLTGVSQAFTELQRDGLLHVDRSQIKATEKGYRYLDDVLQRLLPADTTRESRA